MKAYFRTVDEKLKAFEAAGLPEGETAEEENEGQPRSSLSPLLSLPGAFPIVES